MAIKRDKRIRLKKKIRAKLSGTSSRPRLSVFRSNKHIYGQLIDDTSGSTLASVSDIKGKAKGGKSVSAKEMGESLAKAAKAKGIDTAVFDRNGYRYTGRIKAFADGARTGGLNF